LWKEKDYESRKSPWRVEQRSLQCAKLSCIFFGGRGKRGRKKICRERERKGKKIKAIV